MFLNLFSTKSLKKYLAPKKANVAPMVLESETMSVASFNPKIAPAARVKILAPGKENATATI